MLIILWLGGIKGIQTFKKEVFPDAVPPLIKIFISYCIANHIKANISEVHVLFVMKSVTVHGSLANFLMVIVFPLFEIG